VEEKEAHQKRVEGKSNGSGGDSDIGTIQKVNESGETAVEDIAALLSPKSGGDKAILRQRATKGPRKKPVWFPTKEKFVNINTPPGRAREHSKARQRRRPSRENRGNGA